MGQAVGEAVKKNPAQGIRNLLDELQLRPSVLASPTDRGVFLQAVANAADGAAALYAALKNAWDTKSLSLDDFSAVIYADSKGVLTECLRADLDFFSQVAVDVLLKAGVQGNAQEVGRTDTAGGLMASRLYALAWPAFSAQFTENLRKAAGENDLEKSVAALISMELPPAWKGVIQQTLRGMAEYPETLLADSQVSEAQKAAAEKLKEEMPVRRVNMFVNMMGTRLLGKLAGLVFGEGTETAKTVSQALILAVGETLNADKTISDRIQVWLGAQTGYRLSDLKAGAVFELSTPRTPREETTPRSDTSQALPFVEMPVPFNVQLQLERLSTSSSPITSPHSPEVREGE